MSDGTFFDRLKDRLLNNKLVAYSLVGVAVVGGAAKLYKDIKDVVPDASPPSSAASSAKDSDSESTKSERLLIERQLTPVYFAGRSTKISPNDRARILDAATKLKAQKFRTILITSHSEAIEPAANTELAKARAIVVRDALEEAGLAREQISFSVPAGLEAKGAPAPSYANRTDFNVLWE